MLDLIRFKKAVEDLKKNDFSCSAGGLNLACWLGEQAHHLVAEIEKLREAIHKSGYEIMEASNGWSIHDVTERTKNDQAREAKIIMRNIHLEQAVAKLRNACKAARAFGSPGTIMAGHGFAEEEGTDVPWVLDKALDETEGLVAHTNS